jgi:hypothetical protein
MSLLFLGAIGILLLLPAIVRRYAPALDPADSVRLHTISLAAGFLLLEASFVVCAAALVVPGTPHFFPGAPAGAVIATVGAVVLPGGTIWGALSLRRTRRSLRPEAWIGDRYQLDDITVVVLPTDREIAFALPGRMEMIILSRGLVELLDRNSLRAVIQHEVAHLRHHHSRYLAVVAALEPLFRYVRPLRDSLGILAHSVERWADDAAYSSRAERSAARRAMLTLSDAERSVGVAAFSPVESTSERLLALQRSPAPPRLLLRDALYGIIACASLVAAGALVVSELLLR